MFINGQYFSLVAAVADLLVVIEGITVIEGAFSINIPPFLTSQADLDYLSLPTKSSSRVRMQD